MDDRIARWNRIARRLVLGTLAYNVVEALVAVGSGIAAGSVALVGFGMDSVLEVIAASALAWRLGLEARGADRSRVEAAEERVRRVVGGTFVALAVWVAAEAGWTLWAGAEPDTSLPGLVLSAVSLAVMPLVALGKMRAARVLGSRALAAEARETLACAWLSLTLFLGLGAHAWLGWGWADPVAALLMVPWLVHEGREGLRGESCGCGAGLADVGGARPAADGCGCGHDGCAPERGGDGPAGTASGCADDGCGCGCGDTPDGPGSGLPAAAGGGGHGREGCADPERPGP